MDKVTAYFHGELMRIKKEDPARFQYIHDYECPHVNSAGITRWGSAAGTGERKLPSEWFGKESGAWCSGF